MTLTGYAPADFASASQELIILPRRAPGSVAVVVMPLATRDAAVSKLRAWRMICDDDDAEDIDAVIAELTDEAIAESIIGILK